MVAEINDYRVSRVVILCKDCGQDVGFYPARHKCGQVPSDAPPLPSLPKKYLSTKGTSTTTTKSSSSPGATVSPPTQTSTLWTKFLNATIYINSNDEDSDNESEKDDYEGETHISRILREYYEKKSGDLPDWLYSSTSTDNDDADYNQPSNYNKESTHSSSPYLDNSLLKPPISQSFNDDNNRLHNIYNFAASKSSPNLLTQTPQEPLRSNERDFELPVKSPERNRRNKGSNEKIKNQRNGISIDNSGHHSGNYDNLAHSLSLHSSISSPKYPNQQPSISAQRGRKSSNYNGSDMNDPPKTSSNQSRSQYRSGNYYDIDILNNNIHRARSVSPNPSPRVYNSNSSFNQNSNFINDNRYNHNPYGVHAPSSPSYSSTQFSIRSKKPGYI